METSGSLESYLRLYQKKSLHDTFLKFITTFLSLSVAREVISESSMTHGRSMTEK